MNEQLPQMAMGDFLAYPAAGAYFDPDGNLYIGDFDWSRILVYKKPFKNLSGSGGSAPPTVAPTTAPTSTPTATPVGGSPADPPDTPTPIPTGEPTDPMDTPTPEPTFTPTPMPTGGPTDPPDTPTPEPTSTPPSAPTETPTPMPTAEPTDPLPTATPSNTPAVTPIYTPAPIETYPPELTCTPTPAESPSEPPGVPPLVIEASSNLLSEGDNFSLGLRLNETIADPFDIYLMTDLPQGIYTIFLDGKMKRGIHTVVKNIPICTAPRSVTILSGITVPHGISGTINFYIFAVDKGAQPPVFAYPKSDPFASQYISFDKLSVQLIPKS
ncbi:MAG: hypothetical protein NTZ78_03085 [Candidatus Aureabacteria bacterium]|nr:hypothetical protein [Candidatus Auribacterota bacterium]